MHMQKNYLLELEVLARSGNIDAFIEILERFFPQDSNLQWAYLALKSYVSGAGIPKDFLYRQSEESPASERDAFCAQNVSYLLGMKLAADGVLTDRRHLISTKAHDCFGEHFSQESWGIGTIVNFVLMQLIKPKNKCAAFVTMRDDGLSIVEWVAHYRALRFDKIFVYSNDNIDHSDKLLAYLADLDILVYIEHETSGNVSPQRKGFEFSIHLLPELRNYEWIFYLDSDEYFVLNNNYENSINNLFDKIDLLYGLNSPSGILYNWRWFVSGALYGRSSGLALERFQHSVSHNSFKSLVRLADVTSMRALHFPEIKYDGYFLDSNLDVIQTKNLWEFKNPQYSGGRINHYWHKSFEEFALKKRRGDALSSNAHTEYGRDFKLYFEWNTNETDQNFDPPSVELLNLVKAEINTLRSLPNVTNLEREIEIEFPLILDSFQNIGGLRKLFDELSPILSK